MSEKKGLFKNYAENQRYKNKRLVSAVMANESIDEVVDEQSAPIVIDPYFVQEWQKQVLPGLISSSGKRIPHVPLSNYDNKSYREVQRELNNGNELGQKYYAQMLSELPEQYQKMVEGESTPGPTCGSNRF